MIELGVGRSPVFRGKLPHLATHDRDVHVRFLDLWGDLVETMFYDVHVGKGVTPLPGLEPEFVKSWVMSTQRRIDVVIKWVKAQPLSIAEVRPNAGPGALGNSLTNWTLFKAEDERRADPIVITDHLAQDMEAVYRRFGVKVFETGAPR